jgi:hypothetical protein
MVTIDPQDYIGLTFLKGIEEDGQPFRVHVVRAIIDVEHKLKKGSVYIKFMCEVPNSTADEIPTYNKILDYINKEISEMDDDTEQLWRFHCIAAHQGPLWPTDKDWKGSTYNILIQWETGESTYEPLNLIASDDPVTCAEYAKKHGLLDKTGWKRSKQIANKGN